jgi:hypothetical protein
MKTVLRARPVCSTPHQCIIKSTSPPFCCWRVPGFFALFCIFERRKPCLDGSHLGRMEVVLNHLLSLGFPIVELTPPPFVKPFFVPLQAPNIFLRFGLCQIASTSNSFSFYNLTLLDGFVALLLARGRKIVLEALEPRSCSH